MKLPNCVAGVPDTLVLVDFDGTLTERDGDFIIAEQLLKGADRGRLASLARSYECLEITIGEYFKQYLDMLGLSEPIRVLEQAGAQLQLRPGAEELFQYCHEAGFKVLVASEGLDAYVAAALRSAGIHEALSCNRLISVDGACMVVAAEGVESCSRCMSCKGTYVRQAHARGLRVAVVGDGASDLCGARAADFVIARGSLVRHCTREGIAFESWNTLADVVIALKRWMSCSDAVLTT